MTIRETPLAGAFVIEPKVFEDHRGYFFESYNESSTEGTVLANYNWVQENESKSERGVLRGLHFQKGEYAQAKLVRVIQGEVFDVAVDIRVSSPTYGQSFGITLNDRNKMQFLVPRGFAHGFLVLSETAIFSYKCDNFYNANQEGGVIYNDPALSIEWPQIEVPFNLSKKDIELPSFEDTYKF